ncbi:hypothetical protein [Sphingomonas qomolangmaensis]|uniref:Transposase n=1 Tax=Sphingomonas qomolangmaensis TaxID=2918765 RepID=A0ABY5L9L1_9SPHN|nr:hypothetical protein [Sphingomonas qomolangmaensis]UUL82409.1 hypothetical protein NMP03_14745 [Sphingomonas qomolangmaensis]
MEESEIVVTKTSVTVGTGERIVAALARVLAERQRRLRFQHPLQSRMPKREFGGFRLSDADRIIVSSRAAQVIIQMRKLYAPG